MSIFFKGQSIFLQFYFLHSSFSKNKKKRIEIFVLKAKKSMPFINYDSFRFIFNGLYLQNLLFSLQKSCYLLNTHFLSQLSYCFKTIKSSFSHSSRLFLFVFLFWKNFQIYHFISKHMQNRSKIVFPHFQMEIKIIFPVELGSHKVRHQLPYHLSLSGHILSKKKRKESSTSF